MGALLDEVEAARSKRGPDCTIPSLLAKATKADRADLLQLLAYTPDADGRGAAIARSMTSRGLNVSSATVQRHRRRECQCPKG